jgi:hypothetical protein
VLGRRKLGGAEIGRDHWRFSGRPAAGADGTVQRFVKELAASFASSRRLRRPPPSAGLNFGEVWPAAAHLPTLQLTATVKRCRRINRTRVNGLFHRTMASATTPRPTFRRRARRR